MFTALWDVFQHVEWKQKGKIWGALTSVQPKTPKISKPEQMVKKSPAKVSRAETSCNNFGNLVYIPWEVVLFKPDSCVRCKAPLDNLFL